MNRTQNIEAAKTITHQPRLRESTMYRLLNVEEVEMGFIDPRREAPRAINHISTDTESITVLHNVGVGIYFEWDSHARKAMTGYWKSCSALLLRTPL